MAKNRKTDLPGGVTLTAIEAGRGQPFIMIPGRSQPAAQHGRKCSFSAEPQEWIAAANPNAKAVIFENPKRFSAEVPAFPSS